MFLRSLPLLDIFLSHRHTTKDRPTDEGGNNKNPCQQRCPTMIGVSYPRLPRVSNPFIKYNVYLQCTQGDDDVDARYGEGQQRRGSTISGAAAPPPAAASDFVVVIAVAAVRSRLCCCRRDDGDDENERP